MRKNVKILKTLDLELMVFGGGLLFLLLTNAESQPHLTLYPLDLLFGIKSPGYNLGHSISYFLHGDIQKSISTHILGIPATLFLAYYLIMKIVKKYRKEVK